VAAARKLSAWGRELIKEKMRCAGALGADVCSADSQILFTLFHHYASNGDAVGHDRMSHSEYRSLMRELKLFGTKKESFTLAKADIIFQRFSAYESGGALTESPEKGSNTSAPTVQAKLGHDLQLEFSEFVEVINAIAAEACPKTGFEGLMTKKLIPLLEKVSEETRARVAKRVQTKSLEIDELQQLFIVKRNRKQLETLYSFYSSAITNSQHRAKLNHGSKGLLFKGVQTMMRDFDLIPSVFSNLGELQEAFHNANAGSASADVLSFVRFLQVMYHTAQHNTSKRKHPEGDANTQFTQLLERMDRSHGRSKMANSRNAVMLRPFVLTTGKPTAQQGLEDPVNKARVDGSKIPKPALNRAMSKPSSQVA